MIQVGLHFFTKLTLYRDTIYQIVWNLLRYTFLFNVVLLATILRDHAWAWNDHLVQQFSCNPLHSMFLQSDGGGAQEVTALMYFVFYDSNLISNNFLLPPYIPWKWVLLQGL